MSNKKKDAVLGFNTLDQIPKNTSRTSTKTRGGESFSEYELKCISEDVAAHLKRIGPQEFVLVSEGTFNYIHIKETVRANAARF